MRRMRACSPNFRWFWKPTRLKLSARRFSWRSCTAAQGRRLVRGSINPMGFMGPKRSVSRPRRANSSIGTPALAAARMGSSSASTDGLADRVQVPRQILFDARLTPYAVVVENDAIARDVERELAAALRQQDGRFSKSLRVSQFIEDIGIRGGNLGDHHV